MPVQVASRGRRAALSGRSLRVTPQVPSRPRTPLLGQSLRPVPFRFDGRRVPDAKHVSLVSSFNRWDPSAHDLTLGGSGIWSIRVMLPPGEYPYLFIVDGVPWNDALDDGRTLCEWGGDYSVRIVA